jgi:hypothetical protein
MADQAQSPRTLIAQLNEALGDVTPYKLDLVPPTEILPVERNAHYMAKGTYDRLVENIAGDQNLSSLPFCWRRPDDRYVCLSGNHRVQAAKDAGIEQILILYTDQALSAPQRIAIQLSHNSIVGQDNPTVLRELWDRLDILDLKVYSGLDESTLATLAPVQVAQISEARLRFETMTLFFLPTEVARMEETVKQAGRAKAGPKWATSIDDFDTFFAQFLDFKEAAGVLNTSTAFKLIMDMLDQWLEEHKNLETESEDGEQQ